jgi:hypothetical protein
MLKAVALMDDAFEEFLVVSPPMRVLLVHHPEVKCDVTSSHEKVTS